MKKADMELELERLKAENLKLQLELAAKQATPTVEALLEGVSELDGLDQAILASNGDIRVPVPRPPVVAEANVGQPREGDIVHVRCCSGAILKATREKCTGQKQKLSGVIDGPGGRRVTYQCQTCNQTWGLLH